MIQTSLLVGTDTPIEGEALKGWVERIRMRVSILNKQIQMLETEKHVLLTKLYSVGHTELEFPTNSQIHEDLQVALISEPNDQVQPETKHNTQSSFGRQPSVVDLMSDDEGLYTTRKLVPENIPPNFPPNISDEDECLLKNIDPRELSYDLQDENSRPLNEDHQVEPTTDSVPAGPSRILNPVADYKRIDWSRMSLSDLRQWIQFFGMKQSIGGRQAMINELMRIFSFFAPLENGVDGEEPRSSTPPKSPSKTRSELHELFHSAIVLNGRILHEKILCFETIEIVEIYDFLKSQIPAPPFNIKSVKEYLDTARVQYSTTMENPGRRWRRPKKAPKSTRSAALRKSISCPPEI